LQLQDGENAILELLNYLIMKFLYLFIIFVGSILVLGNGCKKDESLTVPNCLYNYTEPAINFDTIININSPFGGETFYESRYQYHSPRFNPNNPNEILYVRWDSDNNATGIRFQIRIFNFCTGEHRILAEHWTNKIDWGKNGWVAFNGTDNDMRIIKANGDSLTRITFGRITSHPLWDNRAESLYFHDNLNNLKLNYNLSTGIIDTLDNLRRIGMGDWVNDETLLCLTCQPQMSPYCGIFYYNLFTDELTKIQYTGGVEPGAHAGLHYLRQTNKIIRATTEYIAILDPLTSERNIIALGAKNRLYFKADVSPDETTIVLERLDKEQLSSYQLRQQYSIYLMNIDGTDERKVVFPE